MHTEDPIFDDDLVNRCRGMLSRLAHYYADGDHTLKKDLIQEGWIGVNIAVEQWRSDLGASLKTFAYYKARDMMQRYVRHRMKVVSAPRREAKGVSFVEIDRFYNGFDPEDVFGDEFDHSKGNGQSLSALFAEEFKEYIDLGSALNSLDWLTRELVVEHIGKGVTILALSAVHGMCRNRCSRMIKKGMKQLKGQLR
jgi:RNA polymerase sigma factor (sigma-70 family)